MINRRRLVCVAGGSVLGMMVHAPHAQTPERQRRIGVLLAGPGIPPLEFAAAFRALGWIDGVTLRFERRFAQRLDDLPTLAGELVAAKVDVIVTEGTPAARAAKEATSTIPVLIQVGADPVANGLVQSLARPGGNLTGFFNGDFDEKTLELVKELLPKAKIIVHPSDPIGPVLAQAAVRTGLAVRGMAVRGNHDLNAYFAFIRRTKPDAVIVPGLSWMRDVAVGRIVQTLYDLRIASIGEGAWYAEAGGLMAFGPQRQLGRVASKIDRLLRGDNPADTPVELPTHFHLAVNRETAKMIGVTLPPSIRGRVDQYFD